MILQDDFRRLVQEQMREQGVTRSELARRMQKPKQYVTDYLNGNRSDPGDNVKELFFRALGFRPRIVLEKIEESPVEMSA